LIEGTLLSFDDIANETVENMLSSCKSNEASSQLFLKNINASQQTFQRLPFNEEDNTTFPVIVLSKKSNCIMKDMTENLWDRMNQVVLVAKVLAQTIAIPFLMEKVNEDKMEEDSTDSGRTYKRIKLHTDWGLNGKLVSKAFSFLNGFNQIPFEDQEVMLKESLFEVIFTQSMIVFDFPNQMKTNTCMRGEVTIYTDINVYKTFGSFMPSLLFLTHDFHDFIRTDSFVMGILSILLLLQDRPGISCSHYLLQERLVFEDLLDKYIRAKVMAGDWSLPVHVIWETIYRKMNQISYIKEVFETVRITNIPSLHVDNHS